MLLAAFAVLMMMMGPALVGALPEPKVTQPTTGVWRVEWNMTDLASYALTNVDMSAGKAMLSKKVHELSDALPSDFAPGKHNSTNMSMDGHVILNNTAGSYAMQGDFRSRSLLATNSIGWGKIRWSADIPVGTIISMQTRTSFDNSSWSDWSVEYTAPAGETIVSPPERYLQYKANLKTTTATLTPELVNVTVEWFTYSPTGSVETRDHTLNGMARRAVVTTAEEKNGQTVNYRYSTDSGGSWKNVPSLGIITGPLSGTIRFKVDVSTISGSVSPAVDWLSMDYGQNLPPKVGLVSPADGTGVKSTVTLVWNASDPEMDDVSFAVYTGQAEPLTMVAGPITATTYTMDVNSGDTYLWRIVATDSMAAETTSPTWKFAVNDPPTVGLRSPANFSTVTTKDVPLEWWSEDPEGDKLGFTATVTEITTLNSTRLTVDILNSVVFHGKDGGTYKWHVEVTDGFNNATSEEMYFNIMLPNEKPLVTSTPVTMAYTGQQYLYKITATDPDSGPYNLTFIKNSATPDGLVVDLYTGITTWTPGVAGDFQVSIKVSDGKDLTLQNFTIHVLLTIVDKIPTFSDIPPQIVKGEDTDFDLRSFVSDDTDVAGNMTWSALSRNESLFNASMNGGILTIRPKGEVGVGRVQVTVTDHSGNVGATEISIDVKERPPVHKSEMQMIQDIVCQPLVIILFIAVLAIGIGVSVYRKWSENAYARSHLPGSVETKKAEARLDAIEAEEASQDLAALVNAQPPRGQYAAPPRSYVPGPAVVDDVQSYAPEAPPPMAPDEEDVSSFNDGGNTGFRSRGLGSGPVQQEWRGQGQAAGQEQGYAPPQPTYETAPVQPYATANATPEYGTGAAPSGPAYQRSSGPAYISVNPPLAGKAYDDMESMPADSGVKPKQAARPAAAPDAKAQKKPAADGGGSGGGRGGENDSIDEIMARLGTVDRSTPPAKKEKPKDADELQEILKKL